MCQSHNPEETIKDCEEKINDGLARKKRWPGMFIFLSEMEILLMAVLVIPREINISDSILDRIINCYINFGELRDHLFSLEDS